MYIYLVLSSILERTVQDKYPETIDQLWEKSKRLSGQKLMISLFEIPLYQKESLAVLSNSRISMKY